MPNQSPEELTRTLAEFAATLSRDDLPECSREHCKNLILDALAGHQGESHIDEVIGAIADLERFGSVRKLMHLLQRAPRARAMAAAE
jgi:hypothetical protein